MKNYIVIRHSDLRGLEDEVNEFIAKGYRPLGGITVTPDRYYQAMVLPASKAKMP